MDYHLDFYASLGGLSSLETELNITRLKEMLDLHEFSKTESQFLSGGNKRKLLIAIALIQGPRLVLFDEASAGLDPLSRRRVL